MVTYLCILIADLKSVCFYNPPKGQLGKNNGSYGHLGLKEGHCRSSGLGLFLAFKLIGVIYVV
jgi:hypothetical protein